jgi:DNA-binding transcriptional LysR family regulator
MADIRRLDLELLIALDALLEERSVTRAAERLALTQSTVSGMLARLREAFGDPLFVRTGRGLQPTPRAEALAGPLKRLLADAEALLSPGRFAPATARGTVTLSTTDYMLNAVVVPFLAVLRREAPGLRVAVRPMAIADLPRRLARGELDLAVTVPEFAAPDLTSRLLYRERYVCAAGEGHPSAREGMAPAEFCRLGHVLVSPTGGSFRGPMDEALAALGLRREVMVSVPSFLAVPALLRASDLVAVLPERLLHGAAVAAGLRVFAPPVAVPGFDVIAVWHARVHRDPMHRWLRDRLARVAEEVGEVRAGSPRPAPVSSGPPLAGSTP